MNKVEIIGAIKTLMICNWMLCSSRSSPIGSSKSSTRTILGQSHCRNSLRPSTSSPANRPRIKSASYLRFTTATVRLPNQLLNLHISQGNWFLRKYPGDGFIQHNELYDVIYACMEENGMEFSKEQASDGIVLFNTQTLIMRHDFLTPSHWTEKWTIFVYKKFQLITNNFSKKSSSFFLKGKAYQSEFIA